MKHLLYLMGLLFGVAACSDDSESLSNNVDFSIPYVITDNPNDPVEHERYLIYREYGVPVYFNDTVKVNNIGNDFAGNPIYRYETIDLNWGFTSHTAQNTGYDYVYLTTDEEKMKGLEYARAFLQESSVKMRPFCMFLVDTVRVTNLSNDEVTKPEYISGFRCLLLSQFQEFDTEMMQSNSVSMLREMCKNKILQDDDVVARFGSVSSTSQYYNKTWSELGVSSTTLAWFNYSWMFSPNSLYQEGYLERLSTTFGMTIEELEELRDYIMADLGNFGFISGWQYSSSYRSPEDVDEDLNYYIDTILEIGEDEFRNRYGVSPLVMEKYNTIADFVSEELGIQL